MEIRTHRETSRRLCGEVLEISEGFSRVELLTTGEMAVDGRGLTHGGFVFGLADYAAMVAVNDPNVVLGGAEVRFLAPLSTGDRVTAEARVTETAGRKRVVEVSAASAGKPVFSGAFTCFVLDRHVLD